MSSMFDLLHYWRDIYDLSQSTNFDESVFQSYLFLGREMLTRTFRKEEPLVQLQEQLRHGLDLFNASWQLSTGLSMETMWKACRPETPQDTLQLSAYLRMEELADRFDKALWRSQVPVAQLGSIRSSIASALHTVRSQKSESDALIDVSMLFYMD